MAELHQRIELSQKRRLFLREVLRQGNVASWDYVAPDQVVDQCLRGTRVYNDWAYNDVLGLRVPEDK